MKFNIQNNKQINVSNIIVMKITEVVIFIQGQQVEQIHGLTVTEIMLGTILYYIY